MLMFSSHSYTLNYVQETNHETIKWILKPGHYRVLLILTVLQKR